MSVAALQDTSAIITMYNTFNLYLLEELCYGSCLYQDRIGLGYLIHPFHSQDSVRNISFLMKVLAVEHGQLQQCGSFPGQKLFEMHSVYTFCVIGALFCNKSHSFNFSFLKPIWHFIKL